MKKILLFVFAAITYMAGQAQATDTTTYLTNKKIPHFKIMQADSTWFTDKNIPKHRPVVIVYFSPECGHCQLAAQEITGKMDELKDAFFVWICYHSVPEIKTFIENYHLAKYKNFRFGRDPNYRIPSFYKVQFTPTMAVYDKQGILQEVFPQGAEPDALAKLIHPDAVQGNK